MMTPDNYIEPDINKYDVLCLNVNISQLHLEK